MKIGIVTVYNSMNCGSFLQAYALASTLEQEGHEAVCVHHSFPDHSAYFPRYCKNVLAAALRGRFSAAKRLTQRRKAFHQAVRLLRVEKNPRDVSCYLLGSDTVWDLSYPFFRNHRDFFWGCAFEDARVISYAPSMGYTRQEHMDVPFVTAALKRMSAVSVRDQYAKALLQPHCDAPIQLVSDPTILLTRADFNKIAKPTELENFLFLYHYGKVSQPYQTAIRSYARERGLQIVAMGDANPWCDVNVPYDPLLFLSLFDKAESVVTNTFHGTVFSNIYEKKFTVIHNEKPKILDFLVLCQMSDKMTQTPEDLSKILQSAFRYEITREVLAQERAKGIAYLTKGLNDQS